MHKKKENLISKWLTWFARKALLYLIEWQQVARQLEVQ